MYHTEHLKKRGLEKGWGAGGARLEREFLSCQTILKPTTHKRQEAEKKMQPTKKSNICIFINHRVISRFKKSCCIGFDWLFGKCSVFSRSVNIPVLFHVGIRPALQWDYVPLDGLRRDETQHIERGPRLVVCT